MKKRLLAMIMAAVMAISLLPVSAFATNEANDPGAVFNKTATQGEDGNVTITLEAWATGETITTTTTKPLDIVLVLDQSGSMAWDFAGNNTNDNTERRQYAMKNAVNAFIGQVAEKYDADNSAHRISIVTFGSDASTLEGWTAVNEEGKNTLQAKILGLDNIPSGATNVAAGMTTAQNLLNSAATGNEKIVIVFTDGVPTTSQEFNTTVATNAIATAKQLKDAGTTIYTIGIFNGVDASQLYGEKVDYEILNDEPCDGTVGSKWGASILTTLFGDVREADIAAGNRFLNYLSNNYLNATEIGISPFSGLVFGWEITQNFDRSSSDYYLTASNSDALNSVFQTISDSISTANQELDKDAVVKDVMTQYFDLTENNSKVKVYTQDYLGSQSWGDREEFNNAEIEIADKTVTVKNYDYAANYVTETEKADGSYGQRLVIEFTVTANKEELAKAAVFPVPTNETGAGIYVDDTPVVTDEPGEAHFCGVKYDANGGVGTVPPSQADVNGANFDIPTSVGGLTKEKAVLLGFSAKKTDLVTTRKDETAANIVETYSPTKDTIETLYAVWAEDTNKNNEPDYDEDRYSITYEEGTEDTVTDMPGNVFNLLSGTQQTVSSAVPSRTGYTFAGWKTSDVTVDDGKFTMPGEDVTFTAQWESSTLTITFNANGGKWNKDVDGYKMNDDDTMASKGYQPSDIVAKIASDPEQTGKVFNGWYLMIPGEAEGETEKYPITVWNDYTPNAQSIAKYGGVVYADWVDAPVATLTYTTRQHYIGVDGKEAEVVNVEGQKAPAGTAISSLISSLEKNQTYYTQNYVYVANETTVNSNAYNKDMKLTQSGTVIDLYYYLDEWNDEDDTTSGGDNTPDCQQAVVNFRANPNGTVGKAGEKTTQVFTLDKDENNKYSKSIRPAIVTPVPSEDFAFDIWTKDADETGVNPFVAQTLNGGDSITYTAHFAADVIGPGGEGDLIPDKYQATVTFKVVNGTWEDDSTNDQKVVVTLCEKGSDGIWIERSEADRTIEVPAGMKPEKSYLGTSGAWNDLQVNNTAKAVVTGDATYTYTFSGKNQYTLTVNYLIEDSTTQLQASYSMPVSHGESYNVTEQVPAKLIYGEKNDNYVKVSSDALIGSATDNVIINVYYALDNWKDAEKTEDETDKDSTTGGDGIPDKYQAVVYYKSNNEDYGTVSKAIDVVTMPQKDDGVYAEQTDITGANASTTSLSRVYFNNWTLDKNKEYKNTNLALGSITVKAKEEYTYTANFGRTSGGGGGSSLF